MGPVAISLGAVAALMLAFVMLTDCRVNRQPDALGAALAMVLIWSITMIAGQVLPPPESRLINPVIDLALIVGMTAAFLTRPEGWKALFVAVTMVELAMHAVYQAKYQSPVTEYRYILGLNMAYLVQLACAGFPGARYVARRLGDYLFRGRGFSRLEGLS